MRYPNDDEIVNPLPELPGDIADRVRPMVAKVVVKFRAARLEQDQMQVLFDAGLELFRLLNTRRLTQDHKDIESFRLAIRDSADAALKWVHYLYRQAVQGRMLFLWQREIDKRLMLSEDAEKAETQWWQKQAGLQVPWGPSPRDRRIPDTATARRIEEFRLRIENEAGRKVSVDDLVTYCGYLNPTMFQRVQREATNDSEASKRNVERMLRCPSAGEFWKTVNANRKKMKARHKP